MRKILEFPKINENDIEKVSKVIDTIANNLDKDCRKELNELQNLTGKSHLSEDFAEYWSWTDLYSLARVTLLPTPPCVRDLDKIELELIIEIIREAFTSGEDDKGSYYTELLQNSMSTPDVISYIMSDQDVETVANRILSDKNHIILL